MTAKECEFLAGCAMFQFFSRSAQYIYAYRYCKGTPTDCARFQKRMKGEAIPPCLLPQGFNLWDPATEKPPKEFTFS